MSLSPPLGYICTLPASWNTSCQSEDFDLLRFIYFPFDGYLKFIYSTVQLVDLNSFAIDTVALK